jgi:hypothetical protein
LARSTSTTRSIRLHLSIEEGFRLRAPGFGPEKSTCLAIPFLWLLLILFAPSAQSSDEPLQVFVEEPYIELHTGPGRGFPVFHVVPRGQSVEIVKRRTEWFRVRTERGLEGWAAQPAMLQTLLADGSPFTFDIGNRSGFTEHRWEMGLLLGDYGGARLISTYGSFSFTPHLAAELAVSEFLGNASNGITIDLGLTHVFEPDWRASPFVMLGTGYVDINPKATLVEPLDRSDQTAYVGGGVRAYLTRRFFLRAEYKSHVAFTSRNDNEEVDEWKLGFAFFF